MNTLHASQLPYLSIVVVVCGALLTTPAQAGVIVNASVSGSSQGTVSKQESDQNYASASVSDISGASSAASAQHGILKLATRGAVNSGVSNAGADAKFTDTLRLSSEGLHGQQGTVTLAYYFDYTASVSASGSGFSNGSLLFQAWAGTDYASFSDYLTTAQSGGGRTYEYRDANGSGRIEHASSMNHFYITTNFTWGGYIPISFFIQNVVGTSTPNDGSGTAQYNFDAGNSAYWAGIVSATADGKVIADYNLSSDSGTDYSKSFVPSHDIPEPTTPAILSLGVIAFGLQRLRKR